MESEIKSFKLSENTDWIDSDGIMRGKNEEDAILYVDLPYSEFDWGNTLKIIDCQFHSIEIRGNFIFYLSGVSLNALNVNVKIPSLIIDFESSIQFLRVFNDVEKVICRSSKFDRITISGGTINTSRFANISCKTFEIDQATVFKLNMVRVNLLNSKFTKSKSNIEDFSFENVEFPRNFRSYHPRYKDSEVNYYDLKETFRFLRNSAIKNNDFIIEKEFRAFEMRAYWNYLLSIGNWLSKPQLLNLTISRWTNNFGRSWLLALGWIVGLGILFSGLINLVQCRDLYWTSDWILILLPTHSLETFVNPNHKEVWLPYWIPVTLDLIHRIFNGFLIFQLIKAFRFYTT